MAYERILPCAWQPSSMTLLRIRHGGDQPTTFLELFFDVVFVFALTQLTRRLVNDLSPSGAGETVILLLAVWWAWIYTTWMTNWFEPEIIGVRIVLLIGMGGAMMMAVAIPDAFEGRALLFVSGYVGLQFVRNLFIVAVTDESEPLHRSFVRIFVWNSWVGCIWIAGALAPDEWRATVWLVALLLDYAGPLVGFWGPRLGRTHVDEWEIEPRHFAERYQQFVIIALGESIVLTGTVGAKLELSVARAAAIGIAFFVTAALWWLYFDEVAPRSSQTLGEDEARRGRLARDAYTYLHLPIVAGVIGTAVANELVIVHPTARLSAIELVVLAAGPVLYLLGHSLFRLRMLGDLWKARLVGLVLIIAICASDRSCRPWRSGQPYWRSSRRCWSWRPVTASPARR
jgi:low temperature requirement protein LtrA